MSVTINIAGAGIGGLAAAALLSDAGAKVQVFERFDTPRPVGSGLVIQPVGQQVLGLIGCLDAALNLGNPIYTMKGFEARNHRRILDVRYGPDGGDTFGLAMHRAALFDVLWREVQARGIPVETGFEVAAFESRRLVPTDGEPSEAADLTIDALGATSPLSHLRARPLPYGAIWGTVDWPRSTDLPKAALAQRYLRADRMVGIMAAGRLPGGDNAKATVFWSLPADGGFEDWHKRGLAAWQDEVCALWPEAEPFFAAITAPDQMTFARYSHGSTSSQAIPGLAHIGDAIHRASPQLGQGANMALLDALALTRAVTRFGPDRAPRAYMRARRLHVAVYQMLSAAFTPQYQSGSRLLPVLRDHILAPISLTPPIPRILTRLVRGSLVPPILGPLRKPQ